jgi:hypothetical protein
MRAAARTGPAASAGPPACSAAATVSPPMAVAAAATVAPVLLIMDASCGVGHQAETVTAVTVCR